MADRKGKAGFELLNIKEPEKGASGHDGQRGGFNKNNAKPPVPPEEKPQKPKMPFRRKLFWGALALAGLYLLRSCDNGDPYLKTVPNRDLPPPDTFQKSETPRDAVTPPTARAAEGSRTPAKDPHHIRDQRNPQPPVAENAQETKVTVLERMDASQAMLREFYNAQGGVSASSQAYAIDVIAQKVSLADARQPIYEVLRQGVGHERTNIAMAGAAKGPNAYAFICTETKSGISAFAHASAKPDGQGNYEVVINEKIPHSIRPGKNDYMTGLDLMKAYSKQPSCDMAMRELNKDMNGSGELAAIPLREPQSSRYKYNWHR